MSPVAKSACPDVKFHPRVLIVDDEPGLAEFVGEVAGAMDCSVVIAATVAEAKEILQTQSVDVLVTDVILPDGDGVALVPALHRRYPTASAVVMTGSPTVENAVKAMRHGAVDFLAKPFSNEQLAARLREAIDAQALAHKEELKVEKLQSAVKRLNESRKVVGKKVDLLCNDLVTAYGELSRQLDGVRTQEGFRKSIAGATDLEQLLCHAMDWLLREIGYSNVAVWLAGEDGDFQLGAYMKYTLPGDEPLTDVIKRAVLPLAGRERQDKALHLLGDGLGGDLPATDRKLLRGQDVLAIHCTYLGEGLACLVFFRDEATPFTTDDEALLAAIAPVFAVSLATVARESGESLEREEAADDGSDFNPGDGSTGSGGPNGAAGLDGGKDDKGSRAKRRDAADWWKRGEPPPF